MTSLTVNTGKYCGLYETATVLYDRCVVDGKCTIEDMIENMDKHIMMIAEIGLSFGDIFIKSRTTG